MSIDSIADITPRIQYTASASQTAFDYPFPIFAEGDISVDVDGVVKTLTTDYTVSGVGADAGGTVTLVSALDGDEIVTLYRETEIARTTDFAQNGPFSSTSHNDELDTIVIILQELKALIGRCIRFPFTSTATSTDSLLSPIANFKSKFLRISSTGILEPASVLDSTVDLSQSLIGQHLYPQTTAESDAGVTPTNYYYPPGNVLRYGTNTTPGTTDMSTAIQAAVDTNEKVFVPDGDYLCESIITLRDGIELYGAGITTTRIIKNADNGASQGVIYANSGSSAAYIEDLKIHDLTLDGLVATKSFSQFRHLMGLHGVKDCVIERVKFLGFRGDGLYLGSGTTSGDERHNENVEVRSCIFDGVNNDNRNGISVIDGKNIFIHYNEFRNCSRSDMPGPVTIEPNGNAFAIIEGIYVHHNFFDSNIGQAGVFACQLNNGLNYTQAPRSIEFSYNHVAASNTSTNQIFVKITDTAATTAITRSTARHDVVIRGNRLLAGKSSTFKGVHGLVFEDNEVVGVYQIFGTTTLTTKENCVDVSVKRNSFNPGTGTAYGPVVIGYCSYIEIADNRISPNGNPGVLFLGEGVTTVSSEVRIFDNKFRGNKSQAVHLSSHTLTVASTFIYGNVDDGGSEATISPQVGAFTSQPPRPLNTFAASDATPSVANGSLFATDTGALTITDFDDGIAGKEIIVISKGAVTFDVTTTDLKGGTVDLVTASGDVTKWICEDGATWRLVAFVDASVNNSAGA